MEIRIGNENKDEVGGRKDGREIKLRRVRRENRVKMKHKKWK